MTETPLLTSLSPFIATISGGSDQIPEQRRNLLEALAQDVLQSIHDHHQADLNFICTHNSRRSHLAQITAQTAAAHHGLNQIHCHSGGTEATACNERTVQALKDAGYEIKQSTEGTNPVYLVTYSNHHAPIKAWSKTYDDPANPASHYLAIMTCDHADQNCPIVQGATKRFSVNYIDPKISDATPEESATYSERLVQIGREMFFAMHNVHQQLNDSK